VKRDRRINASWHNWQVDPFQTLEVRNHYIYPPKKTPEPGPSNSIFAAIFRELHYRYKKSKEPMSVDEEIIAALATEITKEIDKEIMKEIAKVIGIPKDKL
jgi:hypothetical protein